ncbi:extracellular solute-binding protein [Paenibacillus oryzisoli]|uniref:ABC transporter substrate-binding protein n=1 Tax=Paenibacillus oryzisoli TaxID=1850517 RepID=UPI003D2B6AC0
MKKHAGRLAAGLATVTLVMTAVGCGNANTSTSNTSSSATASATDNAAKKQIELEFWTINLKKNFEAYITQSLIAAYEADHPNIKIKWVDVPGAEVTKKFITALSSDKVPDVVNETAKAISQLQGYDALLPLSDILEPAKFEPYIEGMLKGVTYGGKIMGLPWYNGGPLVQFINKDLYLKTGLNPAQPAKTYDELFARGNSVHDALKKVYGSNDFPFINVLISEGLPILSDDRKQAVFNSPEHVAFIEKFVQAYKSGAIAPGAIGKDNRQYQQTLDNELIAQSGQNLTTEINNWAKSNPSVLEKLIVAPAVTGKAGTIAISDYQTFVIPKRSQHPKEAADFALFVTSHQKQLEFAKLVAIFPSTKETLNDEFFTNVKGTDLQSTARKIQVESAKKMTLGSLGINNEVTITEYYNEKIRAAFLGNMTVKQALDDAKAYWDAELAKQ